MSNEPTKDPIALARHVVDSDIDSIMRGGIVENFMMGVDATKATPALVSAEMSRYLIGDVSSLLKAPTEHSSDLLTTDRFRLVNRFTTSVHTGKSTYVLQHLLKPILEEVDTDCTVSLTRIECEDSTIRFVYETEAFSTGEAVPTDRVMEDLRSDARIRLERMVEIFGSIPDPVGNRDARITSVIDDYRARYERALVASKAANG